MIEHELDGKDYKNEEILVYSIYKDPMSFYFFYFICIL
jgi:hypothetical protein